MAAALRGPRSRRSGHRIDTFERRGCRRRRAESAALLQLYAAESALARAQADLARLEARSAELARAEQGARQRTEIVRRSLAASQQRVAILLRDLYVQGEPDPIAVILGATSLDEAMAGIEGLSRATAQNERLGDEAEQRARRLARLRADLAARRASLDRARTEARTRRRAARRRRRRAARDGRGAPPAPGADGAAAAPPCRRRRARPSSAPQDITQAAARRRRAAAGRAARPRTAPAATAPPPRRHRHANVRRRRRRLPPARQRPRAAFPSGSE